MNVGIVLLVAIRHCLEDGPRPLRGSGVIEINQWFVSMNFLMQYREVIAKRLRIDGCRGWHGRFIHFESVVG
jgi:hypothetical protein